MNANKAALKIGDRVNAYGTSYDGSLTCVDKKPGTLISAQVPGREFYAVRFGDQHVQIFHRYQLRRLEKKQRREWLVRFYPEKGVYGGEAFNCSCDVSDSPECKERYNCIRVREVKSK